MDKLKTKVALITGSTKSIGLAIAKTFAEENAQVIAAGRLPKSEGEEFAKSIGASDYLRLDVCRERDWQQACDFIAQKYQRLDILLNNAGIDRSPLSNKPQDIENITLEDWQIVHAVNLDGTFLGCKTMLPLLKKSSNASIINMGSRSGLVGTPTNAAYASAKAAVLNFTRTVAIHCANKGLPIRCNVIVPAAILTNMWDVEFGNDHDRNRRIEEYASTIPLRRMGQAQEVAKLALFLASDDSLFITGSQYNIDGGILAGLGAYESKDLSL